MPTATPYINQEYPERLEERTGGLARLTRTYKVDTWKVTEALDALGLPLLGDGYDATPVGARLKLVSRQPRYWFGYEPAAQRAGFCLVDCVWETPGWGGRVEPRPVAGRHWSEVVFGEDTQTVLFGVDDDGNVSPSARAINNGDGYGKRVGRMSIRVHVIKPLAAMSSYPWSLAVSTARKQALNRTPITLPEFMQQATAPMPEIPARNLRYNGITDVRVEGETFEIVHEMEWSDDFTVSWRLVDSEGNPAGYETAQVNEAVDFAALFA